MKRATRAVSWVVLVALSGCGYNKMVSMRESIDAASCYVTRITRTSRLRSACRSEVVGSSEKRSPRLSLIARGPGARTGRNSIDARPPYTRARYAICIKQSAQRSAHRGGRRGHRRPIG